ncbi:hypothetical protein [Streptomyces aurantiacus]|uniref:hypothetical protein n=1 Tax=Streptomyces aurantiacus TaxID=47760 RepID=UPI000AB852F2|nr:hypothetical protein [Streptomyces aurantiacus]
MSDVRHVLVLPDRDAAQDAEDAQWLLVLRDENGRLDAGELDEFAGEWDGWREEP